MVALGDGSMGMLPEDWLKKYGMLADLGTAEDGCLRFGNEQAGLLDALLAAQPEIRCDAAFTKVRERLHQFEGIEPMDAPAGFHGELRPYQREGLGWLDYLQKFDFGGILADDMGLGKTIQVLALLQRRRRRRQAKGPSLAVVPRSLVFNWIQEAAQFTPRLRVLDYTGPGRHALRDEFRNHDLVVTTYGTLRTDIVELSRVRVRLRDPRRGAGDQERRQPGRQGRPPAPRQAPPGDERHADREPPGRALVDLRVPQPRHARRGARSSSATPAAAAAAMDDGDRTLLAKALRPFILRRTKAAGRQGPPREDRADPPLRHGARRSASSTRSCGPTTARPSSARNRPS